MGGVAAKRSLDAALCAAIVLATAAVYWAVGRHGFVNYDDPAYVADNPHVLAGLTWEGARWALGTTHAANWHPLTWLSHMADVEMFGVDPGAHHLVSLALHLLNAVTVYFLLRRMTGAAAPAAFVGAAFALHPLHVESVAWIAERKDVLSALCGLWTLVAWQRWARRRSGAAYTAALALFALGLGAKPMLVTLPALMLLLDFWPLGRLRLAGRRLRGEPRVLLEKLPFLALALAAAAITIVAQHGGGAVLPIAHVGLGARTANAAVSCVAYLAKTVWPSALAVPYPYPSALPWWKVAASAFVLAAISGLALGTARARPYLIVGWLWYLVMLVPVLGIVQVGDQAMADRYTYLPLLGVFVAVAWSARDWAAPARRRRVVAVCTALAALFALAVTTRRQVAVWTDTSSLFRNALEVTEGNYVAHTYLAVALEQQGRLDEALQHLEAVDAMGAAFADAYYTLGRIHEKRGDPERAANDYRRALDAQPDHAGALLDLGRVLEARGERAQALAHYRRALELQPDDAALLNNLGVVLTRLGRPAEAAQALERARTLAPRDVEVLNNLGVALLDLDRDGEAAALFRLALDESPRHVAALFNLGVCAQRAGRFDEAESHFAAALDLDPGAAGVWAALGDTRARAGDVPGAVEAYRRALAADPEAAEIREKLAVLGAVQTPRE